MLDLEDFRDHLVALLGERKLESIAHLLEQSKCFGERAIIPVCIGLARIKTDHLYEQEGYRSLSEFAETRLGLDDSRLSNYVRIGLVVIKYELHLLDWLIQPDSDVYKLLHFDQAMKTHALRGWRSIISEMDNSTVEKFRTFAYSDPKSSTPTGAPLRLSAKVYESSIENIAEQGMDSNGLQEAYQLSESGEDYEIVQELDPDDERRAGELLRDSGTLVPGRTARIAQHVSGPAYSQLREHGTEQGRAVLQNSYRADSGGVYHRSTLISAEEKSVLEELWLRSGLKNPEITRIETSHEQTCSRDLYLLPLDQISTDYF
jgi:hypothetical protein